MKINITIGPLSMEAELNHSATSQKIIDALPIKSRFSTWGDEIYFAIPVNASLDETAQEELAMGDLGYWPTGKAFCIFFGPTPMSSSDKIIPASAVNIIGHIIGDATRFKEVVQEGEIRLACISDEKG
jgi:hypothetical protein